MTVKIGTVVEFASRRIASAFGFGDSWTPSFGETAGAPQEWVRDPSGEGNGPEDCPAVTDQLLVHRESETLERANAAMTEEAIIGLPADKPGITLV